MGLFVLPEVIDSDYEGEIRMFWTPEPHCYIPAGQPLVQLVPLSNKSLGGKSKCGMGGFGSTGRPEIF